MTDNGDGTYTIENTKTGQSKRVKREELGQYGLTPPQAPVSGVNKFFDATAPIVTGITSAAGNIAGAPGRIGGGTLGGGLNEMFRQITRNALGQSTEKDYQENLPNLGKAAGMAGLSSILGEGISKGLGYLAHPIKSSVGIVDNLLKKSGKALNMSELLDFFEKYRVPELAKKSGYVDETVAASKALRKDVAKMVALQLPEQPLQNISGASTEKIPNNILQKLTESLGFKRMGGVGPGEAGPPGYLKEMFSKGGGLGAPEGPLYQPTSALESTVPGGLNLSNLPLAESNDIKRRLWGLGEGRETMTGKGPKPTEGVYKSFQNVLKEAIASAEPGISKPNKVASTFLGIQNFLDKPGLAGLTGRAGIAGTAGYALGGGPMGSLAAVLATEGLKKGLPAARDALIKVPGSNATISQSLFDLLVRYGIISGLSPKTSSPSE